MNRISVLQSRGATTPPWSLRLFGGFDFFTSSSGPRIVLPGKRERVLLAYLVLHPHFRQPRRNLAALLWGDAANETTLDNLRTCIWALRKALNDTEHRVIISEGEDLALDPGAFDVDVWRFHALAVQQDRVALESAAELYTGEFLKDLSIDSEGFESWRRMEAGKCLDQAIDVLSRLIRQLTAAGDVDGAIRAGQRLLALDPLHEHAARDLMRHYSEMGRRGAAVELYHSLAHSLRTELDAEPNPETRRAFAEMSRASSAPANNRLTAAATPQTLRVKPQPEAAAATAPEKATAAVVVRRRNIFLSRQGLNFAAGAVLVLAAAVLYTSGILGPPATEQRTGSAPPPVTARPLSIAVLPFVNLSGDPEQEFFSDGITTEVTAALAKIPELRIVGRSSAFQFKGRNEDLRTVGSTLNANLLVEGSLRREGNRVRVTAQLVEAASGVNLWAESYDRQAGDIISIQDEIARTIAGALVARLRGATTPAALSRTALHPHSYQQYLQAKALVRGRSAALGLQPLMAAAALLEQVTTREPNYAPAWSQLARVFELMLAQQLVGDPAEVRSRVAAALAKAEMTAERAIALDPADADAYLALGSVAQRRGQLAQAEEMFDTGLRSDRNNPDLLFQRSILLAQAGRSKDALVLLEQLQALESSVTLYNAASARLLWVNGHNGAAIQKFDTMLNGREPGLAKVYASMGRFQDAADTLREGAAAPGAVNVTSTAADILETAPAKTPDPDRLPKLALTESYIYAYVGAPERVLEPFEEIAETGYAPNVYISHIALLWHPVYADLRRTERFKSFARKIGLVDYWKTKTWPDLCRPVGAGDFACD